MRHIVLLSNGIYEHSFRLFKTREDAVIYVRNQKQYKTAIITELTEDVEL